MRDEGFDIDPAALDAARNPAVLAINHAADQMILLTGESQLTKQRCKFATRTESCKELRRVCAGKFGSASDMTVTLPDKAKCCRLHLTFGFNKRKQAAPGC